jgi:membrane protease YdiL (CAAX protease family)
MPMQIAGYWNSDSASLVRALIGTFFARFIFTWLYNKTKGGILPAMLFHASANMSFAVLPTTHVNMVLEAVLAIMIVVGAKMWVKLTPPPAAVPGSENAKL